MPKRHREAWPTPWSSQYLDAHDQDEYEAWEAVTHYNPSYSFLEAHADMRAGLFTQLVCHGFTCVGERLYRISRFMQAELTTYFASSLRYPWRQQLEALEAIWVTTFCNDGRPERICVCRRCE